MIICHILFLVLRIESQGPCTCQPAAPTLSYRLSCFDFFFKTRSYVAQISLDLLILRPQLLSAGLTDMHHYPVLEMEPWGFVYAFKHSTS